MKLKINEEVLCVLIHSPKTEIVEVDYLPIRAVLNSAIKEVEELCESEYSTIIEIVNFLKSSTELEKYDGQYKYCQHLDQANQGFTISNKSSVEEINKRYEWILQNQKLDPDNYDIEAETINLKEEILSKYLLLNKAIEINKAYDDCQLNSTIIMYSHRIRGWSNPVYNLTSNFSVEIKTNFGYGRASYFFTKLKYKGIEITPFSEWVNYESASFIEIVRYTKKHNLENENWLEAMEFCMHACNLSLTNLDRFVDKYFIAECEIMISGLESIIVSESFNFSNRSKAVDKKGHLLVEFRGEKISGALDFISKILDLKEVISIKAFIDRIEKCNKTIQPHLLEELNLIKPKLEKLNFDLGILKPIYLKLQERNNQYTKEKTIIKNELSLNVNLVKSKPIEESLKLAFETKFPEYLDFLREYDFESKKYFMLSQELMNMEKTFNNIALYNKKILSYFNY